MNNKDRNIDKIIFEKRTIICDNRHYIVITSRPLNYIEKYWWLLPFQYEYTIKREKERERYTTIYF